MFYGFFRICRFSFYHRFNYDLLYLETIHKEYFSEEFDPSAFELTRLAEPSDQASIDLERKLLLKQLTVVSKKVFKLILDGQSDYTAQLDHIISVQVGIF